MRMFISLSILIFIFSCSVSEKEILLTGKIAVSSDRGYIIYDSGSEAKRKVYLQENNQFWHSSLLWLNTRDAFVGVEGIKTATGGTLRSNVVHFDLSGNIVERIYDSKPNEIVGYAYPSWGDKLLLFTSSIRGDVKADPFQGISNNQSLVILDLKSKEVIKRIENIGVSSSLQFEESPWLYDEHRFVYSISGENKITNGGRIVNPVGKGSAGVYIYDLKTDQHLLLVPDGRFAIASPNRNQIAFMKEKSVRLLNLDDHSEKTIYDIGPKEKVPDIHWTPDGKYIYLVYFDYYLGDVFTSGEKLIEVSTGNELPFKKIGHGFAPYTWK